MDNLFRLSTGEDCHEQSSSRSFKRNIKHLTCVFNWLLPVNLNFLIEMFSDENNEDLCGVLIAQLFVIDYNNCFIKGT